MSATPIDTKPVDVLHASPDWFQWALHEVGTREVPPNRGPAVRRYIALGHSGHEGDPWCAIFVNAALESCGVPGTRSPSSQSFRHDAGFVRLSGPALGALAVFWRHGQGSGQGHVGFYRGELDNHVWVLGGNEGDMVQIEAFPVHADGWGLWGFWWPKSRPLPAIGPVRMPAGSSSHLTQPGKVT